MAHFLLGMDENDKVIEEDLKEIREVAPPRGCLEGYFFDCPCLPMSTGLYRFLSKMAHPALLIKVKRMHLAIGVGVFF
ncbi:MAG: hypothetical protein IPK94_06110 [Saprospiraceae bacterium]|nr:hypothetical protein [Saprospiraceae bacterium]